MLAYMNWWEDDGGKPADDPADDYSERESGEYEAKLGGAEKRFVRVVEEAAPLSGDAEKLLVACTGPTKVDVLAMCTGLPRLRALRALCELFEHGAIRGCEA
ncbi:MAG: hypothetical protein JWM74_504 [Myxococcaceae bacterium]|nr:hypothetical protein [Myxococcaceae bacterium]